MFQTNGQEYRALFNQEFSENIEFEMAHDIQAIKKSRFDPLYDRALYHHDNGSVEIIYPVKGIDRWSKFLASPDKIRHELSIMENEHILTDLETIIIRPRFVEYGGVELAAIYEPESYTMVLYLSHQSALHNYFKIIGSSQKQTSEKFFISKNDFSHYSDLASLSYHFSRLGY